MNELLKQRILRRLDALSDERGYQVLDYVEFLESRYAERGAGGGIIAKLTETAEDTMRAAGVPLKAISGTMGLVDSASKVMKGVAAAASSVVEEAVKGVGSPESRGASRAPAPPPARGTDPPA
jgi:hypothetical protein